MDCRGLRLRSVGYLPSSRLLLSPHLTPSKVLGTQRSLEQHALPTAMLVLDNVAAVSLGRSNGDLSQATMTLIMSSPLSVLTAMWLHTSPLVPVSSLILDV